MAVACVLGVAACDQPPEEADQSTEGVSLPDCASVCGVKKSCTIGCSVQSGGGRIAQTCYEYMGGSCGGKDEPSEPGDPSNPQPNGGSGGPHACYEPWCQPYGSPQVIGVGINYVNVSTKTRPNQPLERRYVYTYAQPLATYRTQGAAPCYSVRCSCDRIYLVGGGKAPPSFKPWGVQANEISGLCRQY